MRFFPFLLTCPAYLSSASGFLSLVPLKARPLQTLTFSDLLMRAGGSVLLSDFIVELTAYAMLSAINRPPPPLNPNALVIGLFCEGPSLSVQKSFVRESPSAVFQTPMFAFLPFSSICSRTPLKLLGLDVHPGFSAAPLTTSGARPVGSQAPSFFKR